MPEKQLAPAIYNRAMLPQSDVLAAYRLSDQLLEAPSFKVSLPKMNLIRPQKNRPS
ncbi:MAG: hypothetical protein K8R36_18960 [Planctomycetales bacterium]|nr:hypothetical protein [Planctomycetales bacterium]